MTPTIPRLLTLSALLVAAFVVPLQADAGPSSDAYDGAYFQRVTLVVADLDRSLAVYRDILGFDLDGISESGPESGPTF